MESNNKIDIQNYFLLGVLVLLLVVLFMFITPFFGTIVIAGVVVTGVFPVHRMLQKRLHVPSVVSSLISLILVALVVLTPLLLLFFLAANEATSAYALISVKINALTAKDASSLPALLKNGFIQTWIDKIGAYAPISTSDVISTAKDFVGKISSVLLGQTTNILKNLSFFFLQFFILLFTMFYFLKDGEKLVNYCYSILPLSAKYSKELMQKLYYLSHGIIYGIFGAAIIQGFLVGVGLAIVGIGNSAFWGSMAALLSPVPYLGTAIVWVPVVITLAIEGHWLASLFLLVWGGLIVGTADNLVKPYLIGARTSLHPLAVLLVLLGGALTFGIQGLIFGPFILTLTLAFLHIYRLEYSSVLTKKEKGEK
jgi:predicted PurR-regulated permease PerM